MGVNIRLWCGCCGDDIDEREVADKSDAIEQYEDMINDNNHNGGDSDSLCPICNEEIKSGEVSM